MKVNPERVKLIRKRLGLNKNEFAVALGVDRKTMQRIRVDDGEISEGLLSALVKVSNYPESFSSNQIRFCRIP